MIITKKQIIKVIDEMVDLTLTSNVKISAYDKRYLKIQIIEATEILLKHKSPLSNKMIIGYINGKIESTLNSNNLRKPVIINDYDRDCFKEKMCEVILQIIGKTKIAV